MRLGDGVTEEARLHALMASDLWDAPAGPFWAALAEHARLALEAPVAGVSLVGRGVALWKALAGAAPAETPRRLAFCHRTIRGREAFAVEDAEADPQLSANPLVARPGGVRAYLGAPVALPCGARIGAVAAMWTAPRRFLGPERALVESLATLAGAMAAEAAAEPRDAATGTLAEGAWRGALRASAAAALAHERPATALVFEVAGLDELRLGEGDAAADARLRSVARRLMLRHRETDVLGRLGRNRLALLLPETGLRDGLAAAWRLVDAMAEGGEAVSAGAASLAAGAAGLERGGCAAAPAGGAGGRDGAAEAAATTALERAHGALRLARRAGPGTVATAEGVAARPEGGAGEVRMRRGG